MTPRPPLEPEKAASPEEFLARWFSANGSCVVQEAARELEARDAAIRRESEAKLIAALTENVALLQRAERAEVDARSANFQWDGWRKKAEESDALLREMLGALTETRAMLRNRLGQLKSFPSTQSKYGAPNHSGYAAAEVPEWELRRLLDEADKAITAAERHLGGKGEGRG